MGVMLDGWVPERDSEMAVNIEQACATSHYLVKTSEAMNRVELVSRGSRTSSSAVTCMKTVKTQMSCPGSCPGSLSRASLTTTRNTLGSRLRLLPFAWTWCLPSLLHLQVSVGLPTPRHEVLASTGNAVDETLGFLGWALDNEEEPQVLVVCTTYKTFRPGNLA